MRFVNNINILFYSINIKKIIKYQKNYIPNTKSRLLITSLFLL